VSSTVPAGTSTVVLPTAELAPAVQAEVRALLDAAFEGEFGDDDWAHSLGGWHVVRRVGDLLVAHASVVPRPIVTAERTWRAGYVEAVATAPAAQRAGNGSAVLREVAGIVRDRFEIGVLSTGRWSFYERAGWERWRGTTWVRGPEGRARSADDDDGIMVLRTGESAAVDLSREITCDDRAGDPW
jgi:aminoglycoside 2'-N-acetyltransferase I